MKKQRPSKKRYLIIDAHGNMTMRNSIKDVLAFLESPTWDSPDRRSEVYELGRQLKVTRRERREPVYKSTVSYIVK
jgi:hypothetical protein